MILTKLFVILLTILLILEMIKYFKNKFKPTIEGATTMAGGEIAHRIKYFAKVVLRNVPVCAHRFWQESAAAQGRHPCSSSLASCCGPDHSDHRCSLRSRISSPYRSGLRCNRRVGLAKYRAETALRCKSQA